MIRPLTYQQFAETVKSLRQALMLTQDNIAKKSQVATRTIKRLEKGGKPLRPYYLEDVCRALGYQLR
jgi:transcriptional regulator with XRE-family HTH domain